MRALTDEDLKEAEEASVFRTNVGVTSVTDDDTNEQQEDDKELEIATAEYKLLVGKQVYDREQLTKFLELIAKRYVAEVDEQARL